MNLLVIGGSDAGISAALRAKELAPETDGTLVVRDAYPNYSICGIPFYISGEVTDWHHLAHRTTAVIEQSGIRLLLNHTARSIEPETKNIIVTDPSGAPARLPYDKLIICTGATPIRPRIDGANLPGVFFMRWMDDCHALSNYIADNHPKSAVIVGAGYIGMEMADALTRRGLKVTVVEFMDSVLMTLDSSLGVIVKNELERNDVTVKTGVAVESIRQEGNHLTIEGSPSFTVESDMVIIAAGVRPETEPARSASVETGLRGAIRVNRKLETNIPDIYAAGDCAETWHSILQEYTYLPLGTTAHKQGRIAGENAVGKKREFEGTLGTQAVKIFDMVAARTGLNNREAELAGYDPFTSQIQTWEHTLYYPNAHSIHIRLTGDRLSGKLLGAQIISHRSAEVSKRIDIIAVALYNGMTIEEINDIDLSYTPPLSSPWDPVQMAAQQWVKETSGKSSPDN